MKEQIQKLYVDALNEDLPPNVFADQVLLLFSVSKRYLLESILEDCKSSFSEYHYEIVESYLDDGC
jgi:hypothetical protein